ncbi:MAG: fibronectin type III domain-containing protein, partial [Endomicrobiales bacterium]|nr:fibronectin type III domain-containing protein [Endomicrobiales bacterium]
MRKIFLISLLIMLLPLSAFAWKHGGDYDLIQCIDSGGGDAQTQGDYVNQCSYSIFVSSGYSTDMSSQTMGGFLPNINNIPRVILTGPLDQLATNYNQPRFMWNYIDEDVNPQASYFVQLSTASDFSVINDSSLEQELTDKFWIPGTGITEGAYWWRVRAKDGPWHEWCTSTASFRISIDTSVPADVEVTSVIAHISSCTVSAYADDYSQLSYAIRYSVDPAFDVAISTTSDWFGLGYGAASTQTLALIPNTTYHFQARSKDVLTNESDWSATFTRVTLCNPLSTAFTFPYVSSTSIQVSWSPDSNSADTTYVVRASSTNVFDGSDGAVIYSTVTAQAHTDFHSLNTNSFYWFEIKAINHEGISTVWSALGSEATLASEPENLSWGTIDNTSMEVVFGAYSPDNPYSTIYTVQLSTVSDFTETIESSQTTRGSMSAIIDGLDPNTTYYARVIAENWDGHVTTGTISPSWRATRCTSPDNLAWGAITNETIDIDFGASSPDNPGVTIYNVQLSEEDDFGSIASSSETRRYTGTQTVTVEGLNPNTTYYARVQAINHEGVIDATQLTSPIWHASYVTAPNSPDWGIVNSGDIEITWQASVPDNPTNTIYRVEMSTYTGFDYIHQYTETTHNAGSAVVNGLIPTTTYYARVIATNWDGVSSTTTVAGWRSTLMSG